MLSRAVSLCRSVRLSASFALVLPLVSVQLGCSTLRGSDGDAESPSSNTEINPAVKGAAAGAVLGGAIGAIAGSTTGDAGVGLAIGSAAGATAGSMIGYQFAQGERKITEQKEEVTRQREMIDTQRREIDDLRRGVGERSQLGRPVPGQSASSGLMLGEDIGSRGGVAPSISSRGRLGKEFAFNQPSAPRGSRANIAASQQAAISTSTASRNSRPASALIETKSPSTAPDTASVHEVEPTKSAEIGAATANGLPPARMGSGEEEGDAANEVAEVEENTEISSASDTNTIEKNTDSLRGKGKGEASAKLASAKTDSPQAQADCQNAGDEAERARRAVSDADRLFYYRRALKLCPAEPAYHFEIGQVYAAIGKSEDAEFEFRQVLDLDPDHADAREQLSLLEKH